MNERRKHHKILRELPDELVEAVNKLLVHGATYREIAQYLNQKGFDISKSAAQRYGKDFLARMERLRVVKEKARAIIEDNPDRPGTEMAEAASQMAFQLIMEYLEQAPDMEDAKITEVIKAIAQLERSAVAREKLKYEFNKGVTAATSRLKEALRQELSANPRLLEQVLKLVDQTKEQVAVV